MSRDDVLRMHEANMRRVEIIRMDKEADMIEVKRAHFHLEPLWWSVTAESVLKFAALVAASERDRCQKACDGLWYGTQCLEATSEADYTEPRKPRQIWILVLHRED